MKKVLVLKVIFLGIVFFMWAENLKAQTKPYMWVDRQKSIERRNSYRLKHDLMSQYSGVDQTDSIYYPDFFEMIKDFKSKLGARYQYLRVYIAVYPQGGPNVPLGWERKLTLIFAPVDADCKDIPGYYYTIPPDRPFGEVVKLDDAMMKRWINLYITQLMGSITSTIDDIPDNHIGSQISDTRSITYPASNITEIANEKDRDTHTRNGKPERITGIKVFFAAYTGKGNEAHSNKYPKRLHLDFEFTNAAGEIIYLDDDSEDQFATIPHIGTLLPFCGGTKGINNGQLCPANCPQ
ncbi:MAG TPA: hypothetical protein PLA68_08335 [Panacibacter sp.]|nr:hypothetical protein [Panacibacter sp.]